MATLDLTIQVSDLSPKVTRMDLKTFFSYCGTVTDIQLERKVDQSQSALVTFMQPYALKTALLLNDAVIADSRIRIRSLKNETSHSISDNVNYKQNNDEKRGGVTPTTHQSVVVASKGYKPLNRAKVDKVEGKYKISEKGRTLVEQTRMAIAAAEQTAHLDDCFSAGALWVSGNRYAGQGGQIYSRTGQSREEEDYKLQEVEIFGAMPWPMGSNYFFVYTHD